MNTPTPNPHKQLLLAALYQHKGDNYARAKHYYRKLSAEQMQEPENSYSIKTRQQILDSYKAHADACDAAIEWVKGLE